MDSLALSLLIFVAGPEERDSLRSRSKEGPGWELSEHPESRQGSCPSKFANESTIMYSLMMLNLQTHCTALGKIAADLGYIRAVGVDVSCRQSACWLCFAPVWKVDLAVESTAGTRTRWILSATQESQM